MKPEATIGFSLDQEHTAILDSIRKKDPRNLVAKRILEAALREDAVNNGAAPMGPASE